MEDENSIKIALKFLSENDDEKKGIVSFCYNFVNVVLIKITSINDFY